MLRDKIIKGLKLNKKQEIIDKIINQENISRDEAQIVYSKSEIEEMDKQYEEMYGDFTEQELNDIQNNFQKEMEKKENQKIKKIEEKMKDNRQLEILKRLDNLELNTPEIENKNSDIFLNLDKYFEEYIQHKKDFNNISNSSIKSYKASLNYLKFFINEDTIFNFETFKTMQQKFQQLPKNFFKYKEYYTKTFDEIIKIKNYEKLNNLDSHHKRIPHK